MHIENWSREYLIFYFFIYKHYFFDLRRAVESMWSKILWGPVVYAWENWHMWDFDKRSPWDWCDFSGSWQRTFQLPYQGGEVVVAGAWGVLCFQLVPIAKPMVFGFRVWRGDAFAHWWAPHSGVWFILACDFNIWNIINYQAEFCRQTGIFIQCSKGGRLSGAMSVDSGKQFWMFTIEGGGYLCPLLEIMLM